MKVPNDGGRSGAQEIPEPVWLESPYDANPDSLWLRGSLHAHTSRSDGGATMQELVRAYAGKGHDFLAVSDHDVASDYEGIDACGLTLLHGCEVSAGGAHILQVGGKGRPDPVADRLCVLDAIRAAGGFAVLNHPNWGPDFDHYPFALLVQHVSRAVGIEICNATVRGGPGHHVATDKWDRLLSRGLWTWGFANDDAHSIVGIDQAWNMVQARDRSPGAILDALRAGRFYASTGVRIAAIRTEGARLLIEAPDAQAILVVTSFGRQVHRVAGSRLEFEVTDGDMPYLRVECVGQAGCMAWTQPFRVRGGEFDRRRRLTAEKPVLMALGSDRAPVMTGRGDDPLWERAIPGERFLRMRDARPSKARTEVRCIAAPDGLYVRVRCEEPFMDRLRTRVREDGVELWRDDSVELFIAHPGSSGYAHVSANAAGMVSATCRGGERRCAGVRAKAAAVEGGWTVELGVPWEVAGGRPSAGDRWGFHVCRNRAPVAETLMWAWVGAFNHLPENYGVLVFDAAAPQQLSR